MTALITSFEKLEMIPVAEEIAVYAADLRHKYCDRNRNPISYADTVHVATAAMTGCDTLYTGDPDFEAVEELETEII
ncbi:MAG: type II toxin-antitoxin system VapC family toxin [Candidatus Nanohalobium sp.]